MVGMESLGGKQWSCVGRKAGRWWHKAYMSERKGYKLSEMIEVCKEIGLIICLNEEYDVRTPYYHHGCSTYTV